MADETIPTGTTLLLKGGRALTPATDWHDPPQADIAIAGDKIAGVCCRLPARRAAQRRGDRRARLPGAAGLRQRALPLPRRAGERHARRSAAGDLAALRAAAAISAALGRGGLRANAAGRARVPALRDDDDPGHADALSVPGPPHGRGDEGLRSGRHPRRLRPAIRRPQRHRNHSVLERHLSGGAASAAVHLHRAGAPARSDRAFRDDAAQGAAAAACVMGARAVLAGALLDCDHAANDGARAPLRYSGLHPHLRIARHGAAGAPDHSRIQRAADRSDWPRRACSIRGSILPTASG